MKEKVEKAQKILKETDFQGWLLFDFRNSNPLAREFLNLSSDIKLTRRFFYFIPLQGLPLIIVQSVDLSEVINLYGKVVEYKSLYDLHEILKINFAGKKVAMEYSKAGALPYISKLDAGLFELLSSFDIKIDGSEYLLQHFNSILNANQIESHFSAAKVAQEAFDKSLKFIDQNLKKNISEYDVAVFILEYFEKSGAVTDHIPIVSLNEASACPHYVPHENDNKIIKEGDFILIDLWCKMYGEQNIYADICRVATIRRKPMNLEQKIFDVVLKAQLKSIDYLKKTPSPQGFLLDHIARKVIDDAGYGPFFTHRLGHNIYTDCHGMGAHIDGFETMDTRFLLPSTVFSIEPGIYVKDRLGIRLETNILIDEKAQPIITAGLQEEIIVV
jgi:Xaa-Pro dipeptidase